MKRRRVIQLGLLVLAALLVSALAAALAFGRSSAASASGPPVTTSGQLNINGTTINVQSFSAGIANPTTIGVAGGGISSGKADVSSLNLLASADASFPVLNLAVATGQHFPTAVLTFTTSSATSAATTITYQLENVIVESVQQSGGANGTLDSLSLAFEKVHWTYTDANGTTTRGWNIVTNSALP